MERSDARVIKALSGHKKYSKLLKNILVILLVIVVGLSGCSGSKLEDEALALDLFSFDQASLDTIAAVREIEKLLIDELGSEDIDAINQGTLAFIRKDRYGYNTAGISSFVWARFAGSLSSEIGLMKSEFPKLYKSGETQVDMIKEFYVPGSGDPVDFIHMAVVIDLEISGDESSYQDAYYDYLFSWGGDLETFMTDLSRAFTDENGQLKGDYDDYYSFAKETIGSQTSHFNGEDLLADVDGVNIAGIIKSQGILLSEALKQYYLEGQFNHRYDSFISSFADSSSDLESTGYSKDNGLRETGSIGDKDLEKFKSAVSFLASGVVDETYVGDQKAEEFFDSFNALKGLMIAYMFKNTVEVDSQVRKAAQDAFVDIIAGD